MEAYPVRILSCCPRGYYAQCQGVSYEYLSFIPPMCQMGHHGHHWDHILLAARGRQQMNDFFLHIVRHCGYDLILIVTFRDEFQPEVLDEAKEYCPTLAWNCDDDWRWDDYSSKWIKHYTYMATTYRHVYKANKGKHRNLLLSQWACTGLNEGINVEKDIGISFVGYCYGERKQHIEHLRKALGLVAYGKNVSSPRNWKTQIKRSVAKSFRIPWNGPNLELPDQDSVKNIWNRSRISFTPLEASTAGKLQIKARVFDMGLSGTLMLCNRNEALHEFYEPGKEYVEYEDLDDCIEKARYYLKHESERREIAEAYYRRTKAEHLWRHRYEKLFMEIGLS